MVKSVYTENRTIASRIKENWNANRDPILQTNFSV